MYPIIRGQNYPITTETRENVVFGERNILIERTFVSGILNKQI